MKRGTDPACDHSLQTNMRTTTALLHVSLGLLCMARGGQGAGADAATGSGAVKWSPEPPGPRPVDARLREDSDLSATQHNAQMMSAGSGAAAAMGNHGKFFHMDQINWNSDMFVKIQTNGSSDLSGKIWTDSITRARYGHNDGKDHYEFGFRRGNEHHFQERHEKAAPKHGHFTTKVRWGDKHGGYGEHYWDYNHDGHDDGGGEGSAPVPEYAESSPEADRNRERDDPRTQYKRQSGKAEASEQQEQQREQRDQRDQREEREQQGDVGPNPRTYRNKYGRSSAGSGGPTRSSPPVHLISITSTAPPPPQPVVRAPARPAGKSFGSDHMFPAGTSGFLNPRPRADLTTRTARQVAKSSQPTTLRRLVFNTHTGMVHDEDSGKVYALQPVS